MTTALPTNFRAEVMPDGKVVVYDVPIFAVCEKQGIEFTEDWIDQAVQYHTEGAGTGGAWSMHIHHTGEGRDVLPAGAFHNVRKSMIKSKDGSLVPGAIADLVFTDEAAAQRAKLGQLLWRSPEIPLKAAVGQARPRFKSLALLDTEAPHNDDLPILTFGESGVRNRKRALPNAKWIRTSAEPVLAFAESGQSLYALMEPTAMADKIKFEDAPEAPKEGGGGSDGGESKSADGAWKSKLDELKAIEIAADDIPAFVAALNEFAASLTPETDAPDEKPEEKPEEAITGGPADPTDVPMKDQSEVVRLRDEVIRLRADLVAETKVREQKELQSAYDSAVDSAEALLRNKGITRDEIVKFADDEPLERKAAAVTRFAEIMDAKLLDRTADFLDHIDHAAGIRQDVPDAVLKFQSEGTEVYEAALQSYRMWKAQPADRRERIPIDRWMEINPPGGNPQFTTSISFGGK